MEPSLVNLTRRLIGTVEAADGSTLSDAARDFVEHLTFASADEIVTMLREILAEDWMALPPWARNLAYRLACLQRPEDPGLLHEAAADLLSFGPDWDEHAGRLEDQAARCARPVDRAAPAPDPRDTA